MRTDTYAPDHATEPYDVVAGAPVAGQGAEPATMKVQWLLLCTGDARPRLRSVHAGPSRTW